MNSALKTDNVCKYHLITTPYLKISYLINEIIRAYHTFASLENDVSGPICANTNGSNTFTIADSPKYVYMSGSFFIFSTPIFINSNDFSTTVDNNDNVLSRALSLLHTFLSKSQFLS